MQNVGPQAKHPQIDFYPILYTLCLGLRKGSKYFGWPLCRNLYINRAVLNTERCMIGNQWRFFLTEVICEYLVVFATILARLF